MIDKNIFQSWYTDELPSLVKQKREDIKSLNPEYKYYFFNDTDIDNFVNEVMNEKGFHIVKSCRTWLETRILVDLPDEH